MTEYKCISCGAVKESDRRCSCPNCGYMMFETPYDRKNVLTAEIESFISGLKVKSVRRTDLIFDGKDKDDNRFPNYDKILKYVSGAARTETFLSNLLETVEQLKQHFTSGFSNAYPIVFKNIDNIVGKNDDVLRKALQILSPATAIELMPVGWGKASLLYSETQDKYLWASANELLDRIEDLAKKIVKFIRANNLYGNSHKYQPKKLGNKYTKETDFKDELERGISETEKIIAKKYVLDIIDDGEDELKEMLTRLWRDIELIMRAPLFIESYYYRAESGVFPETEFLSLLSDKLCERYAALEDAINIKEFLDDKNEDELFELYKKLIGIDKFGLLVPVGTELINIGESERKLEMMIGLSGIKDSIRKIKAYAISNKDSDDLNIHMCFLGNPGTGKTEVARYIAGILYENKILPTSKVIEVDRSGLVSQYFGATAEKTRQVISRAIGGVLFVDEAYALGNNADGDGISDYGKEAIDTLVKAMEDYRGKLCVILAGYKNETLQMLSVNPGFKSRIQFILDFPNYSRDELKSITELMLAKRSYTIDVAAMNRVLDITDIRRKESNFANAREIRNILDQVIMCQNMRCMGANDHEIGIIDVNQYILDAKINLPVSSTDSEKKILTGEEELAQLIGLDNIKRMVKKIKAYAKRNKGEADFNLHMCFYGNPGTGKTEVARLLSRILYDAGILDEAKLIETDGRGLLGKFVGQTAPKTEEKINEAMGGVLFIDEAYSLVGSASVGGGSTNYGDEAIAVLLKEMEDKRGQFCVVLAGYMDEMKEMLKLNPGFESRIQFTLNFPDYSREDLGEIAKMFLRRKKYDIEESALEKVLDITEYYRKRPNFANARTVRNVLDQVIMNQNLRTEDFGGNSTIILEDVENFINDEGIDISNPDKGTRKIGFV